MTNAKKLGIWVDHSRAHLMEFTSTPIQTNVIESEFSHEDKEKSMRRSENQMHNRENHEQAGYYKKIGEAIRHYEEVVIFGPTEAKVELLNTLNRDHRFAGIKIKLQEADKMTENQQHAFVKKYFSRK